MHVDRDAEAAVLRVPVVRRNLYESALQLGGRLTRVPVYPLADWS
jgi:hypothetical protein